MAQQKYLFKKRFFIICFILILILLLGVFILFFSKDDSPEPKPQEEPEKASVESISVDLYSEHACVYDLDNGVTLFEKASEEPTKIASLTKIMTALVAIENIEDLDAKTEISYETISYLQGTDIAAVGFYAGEELSCRDLLYGLLFRSGADCALTLAETVSGSTEDFVNLMNEKAEELGMKNSHFENPIGIDGDKTYSTTSDLVLLLENALKNKDFRKIFTDKKYTVRPTNKYTAEKIFKNNVLKESKEKCSFILGGKTGTTPEAGLCLATLAEINDNEYLCVTANAEPTDAVAKPQYEDAWLVYKKISEALASLV